MKRILIALLALCFLLLAGCAKRNAPPAEPEPEEPVQTVTPDEPQSAPPEQPEPEPFDGVTEITCGGLVIPIPYEYAELMLVETDIEPWMEHWTPLVSFSETASVEAGMLDHPDEDWGDGWLCTLVRLDRIGFENWISGDLTGTYLFARDGEDTYYLMLQPTDVRFYRAEGTEQTEEDFGQWGQLNAWADELPAAILERNDLIAYNASDLFEADYTYGGEHVDYSYQVPMVLTEQLILSLSQPARQGEGGIWCVERIRQIYSDNYTDMRLVFPVALGVDETAADYYAHLQSECDAGLHPELLTPQGAALDYARNDAVKWLFGEDVSETDFEPVESLG